MAAQDHPKFAEWKAALKRLIEAEDRVITKPMVFSWRRGPIRAMATGLL
jgi:hypothetical protein